MAVLPRQYIECVLLPWKCRFSDDTRCNYISPWNLWVRWLVLALVILGAIAIFCIFSCISARLRKKRGFKPFRGTGWALGRTPPGHGVAIFNPQLSPQRQQEAPQQRSSTSSLPSYAQASRPGNNDIELQAPKPSHAGDRDSKSEA